jgi:hypothetical protein
MIDTDRQVTTKLAPALCVVFCVSCARTPHAFRVVPAAPNYLLRYPDSHEAPFPEVLRIYNGFEPGRGWMDLRPDMELRIEDAYYRPGMPRRGLDGFLGTEVARYKVRSRGGLELLSLQSMKDRPPEQLPVQELIAPVQRRRRYYRFYYEILFRRSGASRGSVLLGSSNSEDLGRLGARLVAEPDSVCNEGSTNCTVFPEACSVSIEMEIVVNGSLQNVLWGSVLSSVAGEARHIELLRRSNGRLTPVKLDAQDAKAVGLPLLPGDHVNWN